VKYKQYDTVKIIEILNPEKKARNEYDLSAPKAGDIAAIVEIYKNPSLGYELECSDQDGTTQWLVTFGTEEIVMELV
jgi:hypothetical protein